MGKRENVSDFKLSVIYESVCTSHSSRCNESYRAIFNAFNPTPITIFDAINSRHISFTLFSHEQCTENTSADRELSNTMT